MLPAAATAVVALVLEDPLNPGLVALCFLGVGAGGGASSSESDELSDEELLLLLVLELDDSTLDDRLLSDLG